MNSNSNVKVIIFSGGVGTRMWPMSRRENPKQFQKLVGDKSMFRSTVERVLVGFAPEDIYVSTGQEYVKHVMEQAPELPKENIIGEPIRRDTLGAVGLANLMVLQKNPNATVVAIWGADHIVSDVKEFNLAISTAAEYSASKNKLVKIDVRPTFPSEHNGWVKIGKKIESVNEHQIYEFLQFIEKPTEEKAKELFASREYLINTGYLVWPAKLMHELFAKHQPEAYSILERIKLALGTEQQNQVISDEYPKFEKKSVDYGIFEKLSPENTVVIPVDIGWTDVGTWELLYEGMVANPKKDILTKGEVKTIDVSRSIIYSNVPNKIVSVIGLKDIVVVDTADGLLVCSMNESDKVKSLVEDLKTTTITEQYT